MNKPVVSVCCLAYNHESYIRQCLDGFVMQQTNFPFEVLIHDDASTDNTVAIIKEYVAKYPDIIKPVYQTENQYSKGVKVTSVYNFPRAQGRYIAMCEGDDYWIDPLKLQKQVDFMDENPDFSFSMGRVDILIDSTGEIKKRKEMVNPLKREYLTLKDYLKGPISQTSSFVFRNEDKPFPEWVKNVHAGDQSLVIIKTGVSGKIKYHEECLSIYRINEKSVSFKSGFNVYLKSIQTLAIWNEYTNFNFAKIIRFRLFKQRLMANIISIKNLFIRRLFMRLVKDVYFILIKLY